MKSLLALSLLLAVGAVQSITPKPMESTTKTKESITKDRNQAKNEPNTLDKKPEDCDDKAKKPVDITAESISLSGTTGCSLDEAHP
ncbi:MAG TPA: hypothetical protein VNJ01_08405 [Bacteriovoracaceae bacterium]|nr:hypothetical protein [Bacteriovoracaceae bacterium]